MSAARTVPRIDWSGLLGVSCNRLLDGTPRYPLITLAEPWTAALLGERVLDVEPRNPGPRHEVKLGLAAGVSVEGSKPKPEEFRSGVVALEDRRTTAASEEPAHARAGLPAFKEVFTVEEDEISGLDSGCGAKA